MKKIVFPLLFLFLSGCTVDRNKKQYLVAEQLWKEGKYQASVEEFDRITEKEKNSKLGLHALLRSAITENLFLHSPERAIQKWKTYFEKTQNLEQKWLAKVQIAKIYFQNFPSLEETLQSLEEAIDFGKKNQRSFKEILELELLRIETLYASGQIQECIEKNNEFLKETTLSPKQKKKAYFLMMSAHYTLGNEKGEHHLKECYEWKKKLDEEFSGSSEWKQSHWVEVGCFIEDSKPEKALELLEEMKKIFPSKIRTIEKRMERIQKRIKQKKGVLS